MKLSRYIALMVSASLMSACGGLDLVPENALTSANAFSTERELNATTTSIHFFLFQAMNHNSPQFDMGTVCDVMSYGQDIRNGNPRSILSAQVSWKGFYDVIYESNLLLENIDRTQDLSSERRNYHMGQAYFAKGFAYLNIAQRYGDAVVTSGTDNIQPYGISPVGDVIDAAIDAGLKAYEILPAFEDLKLMNGQTPSAKQYASKGAAAALLAHAYAWKAAMIKWYGANGDAQQCYQNAIKYCSDIIDGKTGNYRLHHSIKELTDGFGNVAIPSPEDIWVVAMDLSVGIDRGTATTATSFVTYPVDHTKKLGDLHSAKMLIRESTVRRMYPDATDERLTHYFYNIDDTHISNIDGQEYALMYKYHDALYYLDEFSETGDGFSSLKAHYNYWRLAGIYLLRAECYALSGDDAAAIRDLNVVRARAHANLYPTTHDTKGVQYAVFKERERELIYESDHRYFDVVRNGYYQTELQGIFERLTDSDVRDGALFLPVPNTAYGEGNRNTLIRQKAYWSKFR